MDEQQLVDLRLHTQRQLAWDSDRFRQHIEALTQRAAGVSPAAGHTSHPTLRKNEPDPLFGIGLAGPNKRQKLT
jgi:hypothetical protein